MTTMNKESKALTALGHDARLAIFRLLVKKGPDGLRVGEIGQHLSIAPSTLAHHLTALVDAGLVVQSRKGREVLNTADFEAMQRLVHFLTAECCQGIETEKDEHAA